MKIKNILQQHKSWLESAGIQGARADFSGSYLKCVDFRAADLRNADLSCADLCNADLTGADLIGADLRGANLIDAIVDNAKLPEKTFIIKGEKYFVSICNGESVRAGCQCHTIEEWRNFSENEIARMDGKRALDFYPRLLEIIDFYIGGESK